MSTPSPRPAAGSADGCEPIDVDHLSRQTLGDRDLQAELLALFAAQARAIAATLERGTAGGASAGDLLHKLCGSARAVGAWRVAAEAEALERILKAQPSGNARSDRLESLGVCVGEACAAIAELAPGGGASVHPLAIAKESR